VGRGKGKRKPPKCRILRGLLKGAHYEEDMVRKPHNARIRLSQFQKDVKFWAIERPLRKLAGESQGLSKGVHYEGNG